MCSYHKRHLHTAARPARRMAGSITDRYFPFSEFPFVISYVLLIGASGMDSRGRRVAEWVVAVDALEAADRLFGKRKVLSYP